ncbi:putative tartrate transporter [Nostocoides japonicum T1-X7]|uniref:Putative tartrate transporter n=1 Tax=Nostocoides japonicum T1-X7 TaxID=1194083 RepID=A0A077LXK4_9MICO|nr:putative tartrate transporter [Tetrasphaera japonica T1-X7]
MVTLAFERQTVRKVTRRIIPFVFVLYIVNYIDRANIGYAALEMNKALGLTSQLFGLAAGLFFIGYFLCEVPSNIALTRFGARVWIARILLTWGLLSVLMGFVQNAWQLLTIRFLLGVAEAGFFPGIILYLGRWFRTKELATTIALFTASIPVSYIIAAPLSTAIIDHVHLFGIDGWRWMFVFEGLPAVLLGVACYFLLTERPSDASWLSDAERTWLEGELHREAQARPHVVHLSVWRTLRNTKVLYLGAIYFVYQVGSLGVGYWLPQILKGMSDNLSNTQIGLIGTIPYIVATIAMVAWSRHSDKAVERKFHSWFPLAVGAVGMTLSALTHSPGPAVVAVSVALAGLYSFKAPFWSVPGLFLSTGTAATAVAAINSIGNLGGFVGPYGLGLVKDRTGSASMALFILAGLLVIAAVMMAALRLREPTIPATDAPADAPAAPLRTLDQAGDDSATAGTA